MRWKDTCSTAGWLFVFLVFIPWAPTYSFDCKGVPCFAPYTQTPLGSPCGCVLPIQVELELDVGLDALFQAISMLTKEIANGTLLLLSQARIVGVNADSKDQSKSVVQIELVPLGKVFDNLTVIMISQRFQNHQVLSRESYFGNYTLVYIRYPGLSLSTAPSYPSGTTSGVLPGAGLYPHEKPLSVDVARKDQSFSGSTIAVILISSIIAAAATFGSIFLLFMRFNKPVTALDTTPKENHLSACRRLGAEFTSSSENEGPVAGLCSPAIATFSVPARSFSLYELDRATNNFDSQNIIGQGGFGQVFCGKLEDGSNIAVKRITCGDQKRSKEFMAEVEMLGRLHHRNLVKLIGVCMEEHHHCLVYELISNGSVESHLHSTLQDAMPLDWNTRLKIALGAARGLAYLHEDANPRVIHRDFKASNILLEEDFTPKISDFGLAKAAPDEENGYISTTVMGTFGYVAPEYAMTGHLLVKSDVYSYGVVLLELLSGKKPIDLSQPPGEESLVNWARPLLSSTEGLEKLVDPALEGSVPFDSFARVAAIASMCVQPDVSHRLFMGEVVQALKLVCNCAEGICSITVSPQDSRGGSDGADQASADKSEPMNTVSSTSFISVDYDSGTAHMTSRPDSSSTYSSDTDYLLEQPNDSFRRYSTSGPSSLAGINTAWSTGKDFFYITRSEDRMIKPCRLFCGTI
eukprot:c24154_g1_i1 orf=937-3012(+)